MSYDARVVISAKLAEVSAGVSSKLASITSETGVSFSRELSRAQIAESAMQTGRQETAASELLSSAAARADRRSGVSADVNALAASAGARYGVDGELIKALIWAESSGKSDAVSQAGAMGLMQLMPYTAEGLGVSDPFDPEQNVDGGVRLLSALLERYGGNAKLALAAYNMGAGGLGKTGVTSLDSSYELSLLPAETQSLLSRVDQYLSRSGYSGL